MALDHAIKGQANPRSVERNLSTGAVIQQGNQRRKGRRRKNRVPRNVVEFVPADFSHTLGKPFRVISADVVAILRIFATEAKAVVERRCKLQSTAKRIVGTLRAADGRRNSPAGIISCTHFRS